MAQLDQNEEFAQKVVLALIEQGCFELGHLKSYAEFLRRRNCGLLPNNAGFAENFIASSGYQTAAQLDAAPILALYDALKGNRPDLRDLIQDAKTFNQALRDLGISVRADQETDE